MGNSYKMLKVRPLPKYHSEEGGREQEAERNVIVPELRGNCRL